MNEIKSTGKATEPSPAAAPAPPAAPETRTFVFLGGLSQVLAEGGASMKLSRFGQRVELLPDLAEETKHPRGLPCIPAEAFDALGFTPEELKRYGPASSHEQAPEAFREKKRKALDILHNIRGGE